MFGFFLIFVILAVIIGIITHSWIWGVVAFVVAIILIPRIILWLSGSHRKGSVTVDEEQVDLLDQLEGIGRIKQELPQNQRGWCNIIGLHVQLRDAAGMERLEAGNNKLHPQIDAWRNAPFEPWEVKKYNPGSWEKLVNPTSDIANWLSKHGGLPDEYAESFNRAIQVFQKEGHLILPDVKNDLGKPTKLEALESDADHEPKEHIPSKITQPVTPIEEYDHELLEAIERIKRYITKEEGVQKEFMGIYGTPGNVIEEVVRKARVEGRPISSKGSSEDILRIQTFLIEMVPIYKAYSFRVWTPHHSLFGQAETNVITENGWFAFDTRELIDVERREYVKQWEATRMLNYTISSIPVFRYYPNEEFISLVARVLTKYGTSVLNRDGWLDEKLIPIRDELRQE